MQYLKWSFILLCVFLAVVIVTAILYNRWFDTDDFIKYDKAFSPEVYKVGLWKKVTFWGVITLGLFLIMICMRKILGVKRSSYPKE